MRLSSCPLRAASKDDTSGGGRKAGASFHSDGLTGSAAAGFTPAQITGASLSSGAVPAPGALQVPACKVVRGADACWARSVLQLRAVPDQPGRGGRGRDRCGYALPALHSPCACCDLLPAAVPPCPQPAVPKSYARAPSQLQLTPVCTCQVSTSCRRSSTSPSAAPRRCPSASTSTLLSSWSTRRAPRPGPGDRLPPMSVQALVPTSCGPLAVTALAELVPPLLATLGVQTYCSPDAGHCWHALIGLRCAGVSMCSQRSSQLCLPVSPPVTRAWRLRPTALQLCPRATATVASRAISWLSREEQGGHGFFGSLRLVQR